MRKSQLCPEMKETIPSTGNGKGTDKGVIRMPADHFWFFTPQAYLGWRFLVLVVDEAL